LVEGEELEEIKRYWRERFGVPEEAWQGLILWERARTYRVLSFDPRGDQAITSLKVITVGIPFLRMTGRTLKPTTASLRLMSQWISRNRLLLDESQVQDLLSKGEIPWGSPSQKPGYVLLESEAGVLGCGLLKPHRLICQIPKTDLQSLDLENLNHSYGQ
jgi:hypothetical protein